MGSFGHIVGYAVGAIDLPGTFGPRLGDTQFKQLTLIASMSMLLTAGVTCWAVTERVLVSVRQDPKSSTEGRFKVVRQIWSTLIDLPPRIQIICWAMFWAWIGWFPFHFYGSTWVGETYFRYDAAATSATAAADRSTAVPSDALGDMGRIGSYTLTIYSFMTFAGAWLLPLVVRAPEDEKFTARPPASIAHLVEGLGKMKPDLLTVWQSGHLMFAGAMFLAPFAKSFRFATALVVFCGIRRQPAFPEFLVCSERGFLQGFEGEKK
jgi:solute carrier family 45, member 1/2/4